MNRGDSGNLSCILLVVLEAFPNSQMLAWFAQKEDFAMLGVRSIGEQDENAFFLFNPGQVEQVGIRMDDERAVRAIGAARERRCGGGGEYSAVE